MDNLKVMLAAVVVLLLPSVACAGDTGEQVVIGRVVDVIARNIVEIESLTVTWTFPHVLHAKEHFH